MNTKISILIAILITFITGCASVAPRFNEAMISNSKSINTELFSGTPQRFTAFLQNIYTKDAKLLASNELPNGKYLFDARFSNIDNKYTVTNAKTGEIYNLKQVKTVKPDFLSRGFNYQFSISEVNGDLILNTTKNIYLSIYYDPRVDKVFETYYVKSDALMCRALHEAKNQVQKNMAISIFKEVLITAIRSYAGASYSGGTFAGTSTSGAAFNGTYTRYDNSWLGAHYDRGLDAIFNGTASVGQIEDQLRKFHCAT